MPKSSRQKQKLLHIMRMLMEQTDENHGLSVAQIIEQLESMGIPAERKSVYDDLEVLEQFGELLYGGLPLADGTSALEKSLADIAAGAEIGDGYPGGSGSRSPL